jgi:UDP-2,3-diacylglucosamine pyrophosphatase LpxH
MMPDKFKIVISDLHLGAGREVDGNRLEDFGSDRALATFLGEIAAESDRENAEVELIVNGDAFEMLQVPHVDEFDPAREYPPEDYHSSSEVDSERKMALIIDGHPVFFDALKSFIQTGPPARFLTFIKGNHDVNLHWPAVQQAIRQAVGATGERAPLLIFEERRISREGIYVEHGNQYAAIVDRIEDMEEPHDHDKPGQLAIPVGSWFVMDVFNEVEREKYWIDGVKPITALVWYALAYDFAFAARAIAILIRALPDIFTEVVRDVEEPGVEESRQELLRKLEDPGTVEILATRYETDEAFRSEFNAELASALAPAELELERGELTIMAREPNPVTTGDQIRTQVNSELFKIAKTRAAEEGVKLVTFGHTHDAVKEPLPGGGSYINSGTWTWRGDFTAAGEQTWRDLFEHPERFTDERLLSYVRIDYDDADQPSGQLLNYEPSTDRGLEEEEPVLGLLASLIQRFLAWLRDL